MFFAASKILGFFAVPSNAILGAGLLGWLLTRRKSTAGAGRRLAASALLLLAALGWLPLARWLIAPLEERFAPWDPARGAPDGIVVLGGAVMPELAGRPASQLNDAAERVTAAAQLARAYPAAKIVYSGGNGSLIPVGGDEATIARALLQSLGVPRERLVVDERSRNTVENAQYSRQVASPSPGERWLLVTSAWHMPRAVGAFRKAGFPVEAYPVDYHTRPGPVGLLAPFATAVAGIADADTAIHEWVGLIAYWLTDRSAELFPGPPPSTAARRP